MQLKFCSQVRTVMGFGAASQKKWYNVAMFFMVLQKFHAIVWKLVHQYGFWPYIFVFIHSARRGMVAGATMMELCWVSNFETLFFFWNPWKSIVYMQLIFWKSNRCHCHTQGALKAPRGYLKVPSRRWDTVDSLSY